MAVACCLASEGSLHRPSLQALRPPLHRLCAKCVDAAWLALAGSLTPKSTESAAVEYALRSMCCGVCPQGQRVPPNVVVVLLPSDAKGGWRSCAQKITNLTNLIPYLLASSQSSSARRIRITPRRQPVNTVGARCILSTTLCPLLLSVGTQQVKLRRLWWNRRSLPNTRRSTMAHRI